MARAVAVVDTPVVATGLVSSADDEPAARILDEMVLGGFVALLSSRLLIEYREVLLRRRLRKVHRLSDDEVDSLLIDLTQLARFVDPPAVSMPLVDPADAHLYHLLLTHESGVLVTNDTKLAGKVGRRAVSPAEFARELTERRRSSNNEPSAL